MYKCNVFFWIDKMFSAVFCSFFLCIGICYYLFYYLCILFSQIMLAKLFYSFMKIGAFTIGGGYAMIPIIENEVVKKNNWISEEEFLDMVVLAQTAPGILAMNISILVGNKVAGKYGALVSALGAGLPSFVIILILAAFFNKFQDNVYVMKAFRAVRPAVVALIAVPVFSLAKSAKISWKTVWIPVVVALLIWLLNFSPIWIVIIAIVSGVLVHCVDIYKKNGLHKEDE